MSVTKGSVGRLEVQPGWIIESDGEGLLTSRVTWRGRKGSEGSRPKTGAAHPYDNRLQCYRSSFQLDASWATVTAEYIGLEGGSSTATKFSADFSSQTVPIQSHPDFASVLKDKGKWDVEKGAFSDVDKKALEEGLAGVQSYLAPDQTVTGYFFTANKADIQGWVNGVGKTFGGGQGGEVVLRTDFQPASKNHKKPALLTGVSYESYSHLWKITFTVGAATGGWNSLIYK